MVWGRRKCMYKSSIEILYKKYEGLVDKASSREDSIEKLDEVFLDAKFKYEDARVRLLLEKDQIDAEAVSVKKAMEVLVSHGS